MRHPPPRARGALAVCRNSAGLTLTELVVALAVFTLIVTGVLVLWQQGQTAYFVGSEQAEVQGDARVAIDQMARDLRKAGRDVIQCAFDSEAYTQCSGAKLDRCRLDLGDPGFTCSNRYIIPAASSTGSDMTLWVQMDLNADGSIDPSATSEESITYAWTSGSKQITRRQGTTGTAGVLAENIASLDLTFEGPTPSNGVCTGAWTDLGPTPANQTARDCIQRVTINLAAIGSVGQFGSTGTATVQRTLRTTVDLRTR